MSLLFLGAKDHRITAQELNDLECEFGGVNPETSRSVLEFYKSRKNAGNAVPDLRGARAACPAGVTDVKLTGDHRP
jgi:hypothetical protein